MLRNYPYCGDKVAFGGKGATVKSNPRTKKKMVAKVKDVNAKSPAHSKSEQPSHTPAPIPPAAAAPPAPARKPSKSKAAAPAAAPAPAGLTKASRLALIKTRHEAMKREIDQIREDLDSEEEE